MTRWQFMRWAIDSPGLSRYREAGHLRHGVMSYLWLVFVVASLDAWAIWANPNLFLSPAYSWAGNLAVWWMWAGGFAGVAVGALAALWLDKKRETPTWLLAVTLGGHGAMCSAVGASVVLQWLEGMHSYATGANKWLAFTAVSLWMSRQKTLFEEPG